MGKELCDFQNYIDKMKSETKDIKSQLASKTEELNDEKEENEKLKTDHGKQVAKLVKQQETLKNKLEKITEEKKEKMTHIKEITKLHKELESDQRSQIQRGKTLTGRATTKPSNGAMKVLCSSLAGKKACRADSTLNGTYNGTTFLVRDGQSAGQRAG